MDRLKEECGVFGIYDNKDAAALTALGLHALQHRGQEGCGIITFNEKNFYAGTPESGTGTIKSESM